jgi:transcriptional regulator with XRE-family HTH domain
VELQKRLGDKVRELREARGWTQTQLGERIGEVLRELEPHRADVYWTRSMAMSRLERGVLAVPLELIDVLSKAFEVDPLTLIEPAFTKAPRDAEQLERLRREQFTSKLDRLYRSRLGGSLGNRAVLALSVTLLTWPAAEVEVIVRLLERLVVGRIEERRTEHMRELWKARTATLKKPATVADLADPELREELNRLTAADLEAYVGAISLVDEILAADEVVEETQAGPRGTTG